MGIAALLYVSVGLSRFAVVEGSKFGWFEGQERSIYVLYWEWDLN